MSQGRPQDLSPAQESDLFLQDRGYDVENNISPALAQGHAVIIDRYILSNAAYQGALGLSPEEILKANERFPWPDLTIILKIEPSLGLKRIIQRGDSPHLAFEKADYLDKVKAVFDRLENLKLKNVVSIKAHGPVQETADRILALCQPFLQNLSSELKP
jgi:dTMP kinase